MAHRFLATLLLWMLALTQALAAGERPNIAIFILDDVGQTDLGVYGHPAVKTPHIDQLAREGMRFDNAFLTTSSCSPSRASILTGLYPHNTRAPGLGDPVPADIESLPRLLRQAGYFTASVGKWHLGEPFKSHFDQVVTDREPSGSADWLPTLRQRPAGQPFFFWFASIDAHNPWDWAPPLVLPYSPDHVSIHPWSEDNPHERAELVQYYNEISRVDRRIGEVLDWLRSQGLLDDTLVILLSDNGTQFGGAKTTLYDEGIRTPLLLRFPPRIAPGQANPQLVSSIDLMPTILQLAGVSTPGDRPGVSLWPTLTDPNTPVRDYIYAERNAQIVPRFERAVRTSHLLYKRNYQDRRFCDPANGLLLGKPPRDRLKAELYDLARDPLAQTNLVNHPDYQQPLADLRQLMSRIMHDTQDVAPARIFEQCPPLPWGQNMELHWPVNPDD